MSRGRVVLAFLGILAAALVVGTSLTAAVSLSGGFDRAAERADLPDLIVRFDDQRREEVAQRFAALPNVETARFRTEIPRVRLGHADRAEHVHNAAIHVVEPGRRGYAIVAGRDVRGFGEVVVEQGVARELDLAVGDPLRIGERRREPRRVVGISVSPDNVAYPLAKVPRVYLAQDDIPPELTPLPVNLALAWLHDPSQQDVTLTQARAVSYGLRDLRFVTRAGVQVLIGQAAGIVIALLVAFSAVAVATAGIMLGASARSEVARRLPSIGVQRAVGFTRARVALEQARRGALVAAPAAALGLLTGWLAMRGPADRLLEALNEIGPGATLTLWLLTAWLAIVTLVAATSAWPAWTATRAPTAQLLRGGELATGHRRRTREGSHPLPTSDEVPGTSPKLVTPPRPTAVSGPAGIPSPSEGSDPSPEKVGRGQTPPQKWGGGGLDAVAPRVRRRASVGGGLGALGARLAVARRARWVTTVVVLGAASGTLILLLALASLLTALRDEPATVGKRYALTANLPAAATGDVRALPGVADAAPRYTVDASAAYSLGQPLRIVAFPAGGEAFEAPPLAEGRRRRARDEVEVGAGLAETLGLRPGSTLAVALPSGAELRLRVSGVVRALENDGRVAYARSEPLEEAGVLGAPQIAVRLERGADRAEVSRGLRDLGARPTAATAATTRNQAFLGVLATVLRIVALTVSLVCLAVLAQALVLTARERRPTLALLRTVGGGSGALNRVLGGACAAVLVPAAALGVALEWLVLGPLVASLAAGYAGLSLAPAAGHLLLTATGLGALGTIAVALVAARVQREPVVAGLREQA